jgi:hypothetical protein
MLKIHAINSDGSANPDATITVHILDVGAKAPTGATVVVRPIPSRDYQAELKKHRDYVKNPDTRQMELVYNHVKAVDILLASAIVSWDGVLGADGQPLPVTRGVIELLPPWIKEQVITGALGGASVEADATEASFRQPA